MKNRSHNLLLVAVLLILFVTGGYVGFSEFRRTGIQAGYDELQTGDPKQRVIELMGEPASVEPCFQIPNCTNLLYYSFLERWIIYVDSNDKLIDKVNHEGFF